MTFRIQARLLAGFFILLFFTGCAHHATGLVSAGQIKQLDVPFIEQQDAYCGPSAVAMVMKMNHHPINVDALAKEMLLPAKGGSLQIELKTAIRREGEIAYPVDSSMSGIREAIDSGLPVIALVNLSFNWWPKWHYVVVTGYDDQHGDVIVHSGKDANQHWSQTQFLNLWARGGNWGLLVIPSDHDIPSFVEQDKYTRAALDLEHSSGLAQAAYAYHQIIHKWPQNVTVLVAMGNLAYEQHDLDNAQLWFRSAVKYHPDSVVALNDLAQVLVDQNQPKEAFELAKKAVRLGGGDAALDTLHQALAKLVSSYQSAPGGMDLREK